ncbi:nitroreductase [Pseudoclavibacter sp. JAI123]|uniref:NADPH-dependent oxidoreductase n=1 Tax=Pseudoclavibacter sp. JAI123 TaxID=2723065 RepID=UPI0017B29CFB|nr:NADPH-dependent oxidoreductase [Pseudoclavibacter sp. JAI123]NYF12635.1 nitroreductase [Pseudoclavibacter sp. JAI123]
MNRAVGIEDARLGVEVLGPVAGDTDGSALTAAGDLLRARYRSDDLPDVGTLSTVIERQLAHKSVRSFLAEDVPDSALNAIVVAAQSAATSSNQQAWSVVAVRDEARKSRLATLAGDQQLIRDAPIFLVWVADLSRARALGAVSGVELIGTEYLEAVLVSAVDTALAAQNAVLAAESLDYGAVYVGAVRNNLVEVARELSLPPASFPVFGLALGRAAADDTSGVKPRLPLAAVLHSEQYSPEQAAAAVDAYEPLIAAYWHGVGAAPRVWREAVIERWRHSGSLTGRDKLTERLRSLGWPAR